MHALDSTYVHVPLGDVQVLEEAMGFCRERLSLSPGPESQTSGRSGHAKGHCSEPASGQQHQSRQGGSPDDDQNKENSEAGGQILHPPSFVPSLLGILYPC